jgi:hypothetical protein
MRGYDTAEYAASRLVETIIRHDGIPVMVQSVGNGVNGEITVGITNLMEDDPSYIVPLSECDINPVSLGYVNHKKSAHYIMRAPMRRDWRQGLRMLNIVDAEGMNPRLIPYRTIAQTIMGSFPSFKSCLDRLNSKEKIEEMAFNRDFAVNREGDMKYKSLFTIGKVDMTNGNLLIGDNFNWVREALEEQMEAA